MADIVDFSEAVELITRKSPGLSAKLRIAPDNGGISRIVSFYSTLKYAAEMEAKGHEIIKIEAEVADGYPVEADLIVKFKGNDKISYLDLTTSADSAVYNAKVQKAAMISEKHKIDYSAVIIPSANVSVKLSANYYGPEKRMFEILDNTISNPLDEFKAHEISEAIMDNIIKRVSNEERIKLDKRWAVVPPSFMTDNTPAVVKSALSYASVIPEVKAFLKKLSSCSTLATRKVIPYAPCQYSDEEKPIFIRALMSIPESKAIFAIHLDDSIQETEYARLPFSFPDSVRAYARRKFNKLTGKSITNRFTISFNPLYFDDNWIKATTRRLNTKEDILKASTMIKDLPDTDEEALWNSLTEYSELCSLLSEENASYNPSYADIYSKMITVNSSELSAGYITEESSLFLIRSCLTKIVFKLASTIAGGALSHAYEVAKTVAAANSFSSRKNEYHVGKNGPYDSYSIVKCTGTQDSATMSPAIVIYKPSDMSLAQARFVSGSREEQGYLISNERTYTRNQLVWHLKLPFVFTNIVAWHMEQITTDITKMDIIPNDFISSSAIVALTNRDAFSQVAAMTRYWYGSSTGDYSDLVGLFKQYDTYIPGKFTEVVYIARQIKMASCIRSSTVRGDIRDYVSGKSNSSYIARDSQNSIAYRIAMPHLETAVSENSAIISMFYISNIFNKYKHGLSSVAICFLGLKEELDLYNSSNPMLRTGLSPLNMDVDSLSDIANDPVRLQDELEFINTCLTSDQARYNCSIFATYIFSIAHSVPVNSEKLYLKLKESPIDAVTLRGGMSSGDITEKNQSIRAASTMIEGVIESFGKSSSEFNDSLFAKLATISDLKDVDVSLLSLKLRQYGKNDDYNYRIVHKDQIGHREISVLNYNMRIGTMFVETIFKQVYQSDTTNMLQNKNKFRVVQSHARRLHESGDSFFYDNSDQSRWGPNTMMHHLAAMVIAQLSSEPGVARLCLDSLDSMTMKNAKIPDELISKVSKGKTRYSELSAMYRVMSLIVPMIQNKQYSLKMVCGMGQGILQETSSALHTIDKKVTKAILRKVIPTIKVQSFVTSDDDLTAVANAKGTIVEVNVEDDDDKSENSSVVTADNKISVVSFYIHAQKYVHKIFNIVRNKKKSFISRYISDFNSSFQFGYALAVPNLKQRISFLDCGSGEDLLTDMISAVSAGAQYIASGGSYIGAVMVSKTNIAITLEQHRAWFKYKSGNEAMANTSVFKLGLPVVEPVSVLLYGPVSSIVLREMLTTKLPAKTILKSLFSNLCSVGELVDQSEIIRGNSTKPKDKIKFLMPSTISGLISLARPTKAQSRFVKRHSLDAEYFPDDQVHYSKKFPSFINLLFSASIGVGSKSYDTSLGVNSYSTRFTEPWVNIDNRKFKRSKSPFSQSLYNKENFSISEFNDYVVNLDPSEVIKSYLKVSMRETSDMPYILTEAMAELMTPAYNMLMRMASTSARFKEYPKGSVFSHAVADLPHKIIGSKSDERRSLVRALYSGKNRPFFQNMNKVSFGVKTDALLDSVKTDSLKDAIIAADLIYNSIMKFVKVKTVVIARTMDDFIRFPDSIETFYSNNFSTLFRVDFSFDASKVIAPYTYITLNKNVFDKTLLNKDALTIAISDNCLYHKEIKPAKTFISSEMKTVESVNAIVEFVDYETDNVFKLNSEVLKDLNHELLALYGYSGDVIMTEKFSRALFSCAVGSHTYEEIDNQSVKFLKFPKDVLYTNDNTPFGIVSVKENGKYSIKLLFYNVSGSRTINLFKGVPLINAKPWQKRLLEALSTFWQHGKVINMAATATLSSEEVECIFISEKTKFNLEISQKNPCFYLKKKGGAMALPMKTTLEVNRALLANNFFSYNLPEYKGEDIAVDVAKALSNFVSNVVANNKTDDLVKSINKMSFPVTKEKVKEVANQVFQGKRKTFTVMSFLETSEERVYLLSKPDEVVAYLIVLIRAYEGKLSVRETTLMRTLLKPDISNDEAPLLSRDLGTKANVVTAYPVVNVAASVKTEAKALINIAEDYEENDDMFSDDDDPEMLALAAKALSSFKVPDESKTIALAMSEVMGPAIEEDEILPEPVLRATIHRDTKIGSSVLENFKTLSRNIVASKLKSSPLGIAINSPAAIENNDAEVFKLLLALGEGYGATVFVFSILN